MISRYARLLLLAVALGASAAAQAIEFRDFDARTPAALRSQYAGRPFILAFWSIHCEPCRDELAQWAPLQKRHPDVPVILVATDGRDERALLSKLLSRYDLTGVQTWAYADEFDERVRFAVDRQWHGELPRTYLYDASHRAQARSGVAEPGWIEAWLAQQPPRAPR
jgi:thiol-disulfide isomerase/thioredoxin